MGDYINVNLNIKDEQNGDISLNMNLPISATPFDLINQLADQGTIDLLGYDRQPVEYVIFRKGFSQPLDGEATFEELDIRNQDVLVITPLSNHIHIPAQGRDIPIIIRWDTKMRIGQKNQLFLAISKNYAQEYIQGLNLTQKKISPENEVKIKVTLRDLCITQGVFLEQNPFSSSPRWYFEWFFDIMPVRLGYYPLIMDITFSSEKENWQHQVSIVRSIYVVRGHLENSVIQDYYAFDEFTKLEESFEMEMMSLFQENRSEVIICKLIETAQHEKHELYQKLLEFITCWSEGYNQYNWGIINSIDWLKISYELNLVLLDIYPCLEKKGKANQLKTCLKKLGQIETKIRQVLYKPLNATPKELISHSRTDNN